MEVRSMAAKGCEILNIRLNKHLVIEIHKKKFHSSVRTCSFVVVLAQVHMKIVAYMM